MGIDLKTIELFAGAGGLALGTSAEFRHDLVVEWDANACATLRRNRGDRWKIAEGDIREYDFHQYRGTVDLVSGGPPCQPFSLGGKHRGRDDHRNLFPEAIRVIREVRPKAFIFENVKGLLRKSFANYFSYILHHLRYPTVLPIGDEEWSHHLARLERLHTRGERADLGYNVIFKLVNAVDYGVPQHRWRVFIVGIRADMGAEFSFPQPTHEEDALLSDKWITGEYWDRHKIAKKDRPSANAQLQKKTERVQDLFSGCLLQPWRTVRDAIGDLPKIPVGETSSAIANHFLNPGARKYPGHTGSPLDEPAKALKAGDHGVPGGENMLRYDDGTVRYFSVRECARIQTFPDDWAFEGSWTESMRQLGNAVPVRLAEQIARPLREMFRKSTKPKTADSRRGK